VFSCLSAAYSYTQGFNNLALPVYYIAISAHRKLGHDDDIAEALAFFFLQNLITGTRLGDLFTMARGFDSVASKFDLVRQMTGIADKQLADHLFVKPRLSSCQFAFSWVSVLFDEL
jgi:hypothetical protein